MKRVLIVLGFLMLTVSGLKAQEVVTGKVIDGKNLPMPGVRVEIVGRSETAMTDIDGIFKIELPEPAKKVRFHYVGYKPLERKITPDMVVKLGHGWAGKNSGYRGFFDIMGGFGTGGVLNVTDGEYAMKNVGRSSIAFGWTMTHGYQINHNFFAGLGFGANCVMLYSEDYEGYYTNASHKFYGLALPVYADFRWDYDLTAKTAPFVDLKLGYQYVVAIDDDDYYDWYYNNHFSVRPESIGGLFIMPAIGLRTAIGSKRAINIGLSYNISLKRKFSTESHYYHTLPNGEIINGGDTRSFSSTGGVSMFTIGFDF